MSPTVRGRSDERPALRSVADFSMSFVNRSLVIITSALAFWTLAGAGAAAAQAQPATTWVVVLPSGPAADFLDQLAPAHPLEFQSQEQYQDLLWPADLSDPGWDSVQPWLRWADLVHAEAQAEEPDARRRAALCLAARAQGRYQDAWHHFGQTGADPALARRILPTLLLGLPLDHPLESDGSPGPLAEGSLLWPCIPPRSENFREGYVDRRAALVSNLSAGSAKISLRVSIEGDGVQVDIGHLKGEPAQVRLRMPVPAHQGVDVEYFDWDRVEPIGSLHSVAVSSSSGPQTGWVRFRPQSATWPGSLPAPEYEPVGIEVSGTPGDPRPAALAQALERALGIPARASLGLPQVASGRSPLRIRLEPAAEGHSLLRAVIGLSERRALQQL